MASQTSRARTLRRPSLAPAISPALPWMKTAAKLAALPIEDEEKQHLLERLETGI